jgi:hypothetical protein
MTHILAIFMLALLLGGMIFFAAVMAPLVFTRLPPEQSGPFIRAVFPFYYLYVLIISAICTVALLPQIDAVAMALVAVSTLWLRQGLMPYINKLSDAARAGDNAAKRRFNGAHRLSVIVNFAQLAIIGAALARGIA